MFRATWHQAPTCTRTHLRFFGNWYCFEQPWEARRVPRSSSLHEFARLPPIIRNWGRWLLLSDTRSKVKCFLMVSSWKRGPYQQEADQRWTSGGRRRHQDSGPLFRARPSSPARREARNTPIRTRGGAAEYLATHVTRSRHLHRHAYERFSCVRSLGDNTSRWESVVLRQTVYPPETCRRLRQCSCCCPIRTSCPAKTWPPAGGHSTARRWIAAPTPPLRPQTVPCACSGGAPPSADAPNQAWEGTNARDGGKMDACLGCIFTRVSSPGDVLNNPLMVSSGLSVSKFGRPRFTCSLAKHVRKARKRGGLALGGASAPNCQLLHT